MKCSFEECNNKAKVGIGHGNSKGSIWICKECHKSYENHQQARGDMIIDSLEVDINKILKKQRGRF